MGHGTKVGQGEAEVVTTQGPARPPAGPAVLRPEGRGRPLGQRPQLPQGREEGAGRRWNSTAARSQPMAATLTSTRSTIAGRRREARRLAREGRQRGRGRRPHEGADRRRIRRDGDELPGLRPRHAQDGSSPARSGPTRTSASRHVQRAGRAPRRADAARSPLFADARRRDGRRPAVPGRLSLRLHRADAQPLPADGHHAEGPARHEARPEGRSRTSAPTSTPRKSATTSERAKGGSASTATRSSTKPKSRRWSRTACSA